MTPKELAEIRECYWGRPGLESERRVRALLEHIDSQAAEIIRANHRYADLQNICDDQDKEIKRLEDALVEERAWRNFFAANARTEALADFGYSLVKDRHFTRARKQLRAEGVIR